MILVGLSLLAVGTYVYFQTERSLIAETDSSLRAAAAQALLSLEKKAGRLVFRGDVAPLEATENEMGLVVRVLSPDGEQWDAAGPMIVGLPRPPTAGYLTVNAGNSNWRVLTQSTAADGVSLQGWIQVARSLAPTEELLGTLRAQLYVVLPVALILAAIAAYFFTGRTLRPLERISQIADSIRPREFGRRIGYQGPRDEIGRLAEAFDRMLDRVEQGFDRERRFSSDVSHELRTPLTAIKGGIGVTLSRKRTPEDYEAALHDLDEQVDRLIRLSTGLLAVARAGRPRTDEPEIVPLSELLRAVCQQMEPLAQQKQISLDTAVQPDLRASGFAEDLARVFSNLLANAFAYTPSGGSVALSAQVCTGRQEGGIRIEVSDTGLGISAEELPRIFEPFYRGSDARAKSEEGSGLGLPIAREIIGAHGGSLEVKSSEGQGSTFTVWLPAPDDRKV